MCITRSIWLCSGKATIRLPPDAGYKAGKIYRVICEKNSIRIVKTALKKKAFYHETRVNSTVMVDRAVFAGMKDGPTIRLIDGIEPGEYRVQYEPRERNVKILLAEKPLS